MHTKGKIDQNVRDQIKEDSNEEQNRVTLGSPKCLIGTAFPIW